MNTLRKRRKEVSAHSDAKVEEKKSAKEKKKKEEEVEAHDLALNECRMTIDHKVNCPSCDAKLGVPRGSIPPFKFTCPKCDTKIRVLESLKF
jgi:hypothetical protein